MAASVVVRAAVPGRCSARRRPALNIRSGCASRDRPRRAGLAVAVVAAGVVEDRAEHRVLRVRVPLRPGVAADGVAARFAADDVDPGRGPGGASGLRTLRRGGRTVPMVARAMNSHRAGQSLGQGAPKAEPVTPRISKPPGRGMSRFAHPVLTSTWAKASETRRRRRARIRAAICQRDGRARGLRLPQCMRSH